MNAWHAFTTWRRVHWLLQVSWHCRWRDIQICRRWRRSGFLVGLIGTRRKSGTETVHDLEVLIDLMNITCAARLDQVVRSGKLRLWVSSTERIQGWCSTSLAVSLFLTFLTSKREIKSLASKLMLDHSSSGNSNRPRWIRVKRFSWQSLHGSP